MDDLPRAYKNNPWQQCCCQQTRPLQRASLFFTPNPYGLMDTLKPTPDQASALEELRTWLTDSFVRKHEFTLAGLAGTGKTTMMKLLPEAIGDLDFFIVFLAPTNKAASVLRSKGIMAGTIHSEFYQLTGTDDEDRPVFEFNPMNADSRTLYVIDEASMVSSEILEDLRTTDASFLFVGDHGQLPPVGGDPGLMRNADVKLETVMRQAKDNEILKFAHHIRTGGDPFEFTPTKKDVIIAPVGKDMVARPRVDAWLCWRNYTRVQLNMWNLREDGGQPPTVPIQIRGNYPEAGLYNGEVYDAENVEWDRQTGHPVYCMIGRRRIRLHPHNWHREKRAKFNTKFEQGVLADYGYAITVHTSQGSEWDSIVVVDEAPEDDAARWRYTAATRAAKKLLWVPFNSLPIKPQPEYLGEF